MTGRLPGRGNAAMLGGGRRRRGRRRRRREEDAAEVRSVLGGAGLGEGGKRGDLSASPSLTHGNVFQKPTNENKNKLPYLDQVCLK